ncbi:DUF983 domain-containing protein [Flavivirga rizhaonensis]|uniref:DUF983 domain-containing protein n=1 Tax=Flavivirga rizhaonensis TaxID=2559571 RepID=A0A4S1DT10_9FLAO|nr:DUF983 domain-containing protein [Flavivirga rizhaonensis]TGV01107.1 DUF983 domain-containing protein [Flavivirga rizhaonensis]
MKPISILKGKCPQCKKNDIFSSNGNLLLFRIPKINDRCKTCNFKFEREPGFFFGAMFVSYAIAVAEFIGVFIISYFFLGLSLLASFFGIIISAILFSTINFRLSRTIWIYLFYKKAEA